MHIRQLLEMLRGECIDTPLSTRSFTRCSRSWLLYILHEHHAKQIPMHQGSTKRRRANMPRKRVCGHARLYKDYFHLTDPVYKKHMFRRRY
jgi:hypothetical protein